MENPSFDARSEFPSNLQPRVWLITAGDSPLGISVARKILAHGDYAFLGLAHTALDRDERRRAEFNAFLAEVKTKGWGKQMKTVPLDIRLVYTSERLYLISMINGFLCHRMMGECQSVVANAVATFGKVDILLCCTSQGALFSIPLPSIPLTCTSSHWHSRGTFRLNANAEPCARSIRNQLLRPSQYYQGHTSRYAKRAIRPCDDHIRNQ